MRRSHPRKDGKSRGGSIVRMPIRSRTSYARERPVPTGSNKEVCPTLTNLERETGSAVPSTKQSVEFTYRLA